MPCDSSHHASDGDICHVACLLDELKGIPIAPRNWRGYHPKVYNKYLSREQKDVLVAELCRKLKNVDITNYSLEMQIWWRNHQKADKELIAHKLVESQTLSDEATSHREDTLLIIKYY